MQSLPTIDEREIVNTPFGQLDDARPSFTPTYQQSSYISTNYGIPRSYSVPTSNRGIRFTRHEMNQLGYLSTLGLFLEQIGYTHTWNETLCNLIGGYPKDAILRFAYNNEVFEIRSLHDNNTSNPEYSFGSEILSGTNTHWALINRDITKINFYPDYSNRTLLVSKSYTLQDSFSLSNIKPDGAGWIYVERKINNWDKYMAYQTTNYSKQYGRLTINEGSYKYYVDEPYLDTISDMEGSVASRLYPFSYAGGEDTSVPSFIFSYTGSDNETKSLAGVTLNLKIYKLGFVDTYHE